MNSNDMMVSIFLIGVIRLLRLGEISLDQAHFLILETYQELKLKNNNQ